MTKRKQTVEQRGANIAATVKARDAERAAATPKAYEHLMVVRFTARQWYPRRFDRKASDEVAKNHGAADATTIGRFNKILIELASIKPLQQAMREIQISHYRRTAPWVDDGVRVMPARLFMDYSKELTEAKGRIATMARKFARDEYGPQIELARKRLNGLFNEDDYPPADEIEGRFGIAVHFEPVPEVDNVNGWGLDPDSTRVMRDELKQSLRESVEAAHKHVVDGVLKRATEFVEKIRKYQTEETRALFETSITNLRESVGMVLTGLNITQDPALTEMARLLDKALVDVTIDVLRDKSAVAAAKAREVDAIVGKFAGVFGGGR